MPTIAHPDKWCSKQIQTSPPDGPPLSTGSSSIEFIPLKQPTCEPVDMDTGAAFWDTDSLHLAETHGKHAGIAFLTMLFGLCRNEGTDSVDYRSWCW